MHDAARMAAELDLLRSVFRELEVRDDGGRTWVRLPSYAVPPGWSATTVEVTFCFPTEVGQPPYAFYVRPPLTLTSGAAVSNYSPTATTPWGSDFAQFSWSPLEPWTPRTDLRAGANMLNFALSFASRLAEAS
jgi:hypothetical protein